MTSQTILDSQLTILGSGASDQGGCERRTSPGLRCAGDNATIRGVIASRRASVANRFRRGFNLVELLIALAITAALLSAVMVALDASFMAYQSTTEVASTHTISRLIMNRMLTMIRTGQEFGPYPTNPLDTIVQDDFIEFRTPDGRVVSLEYKQDPDPSNGYPRGEALYVKVDDGVNTPSVNLLLEGVKRQYVPNALGGNDPVKPFTLQFEKGRHLYRATIDLTVVPDDNMSVQLDGRNENTIRLVASAMPRMETF